jgi:CPA1 family monovalent cation:H+ antiporter
MVALIVGLPLPIGLLFGSVVAATDPVAVVGVFRSLRAPARLATIAESESLINDGVAITLYATLGAFALGQDPSVAEALIVFAREMLGGVLIGLVAGFVFSRLNAAIDDHLIEMLLSVALAYGSYVAAQWLHASGPLACVAAGLVHGSYGRRVGMSVTTRRLLDDLWEFLGFMANAAVFLMIGFTVNLDSLLANAWPCLVAIVVVLLARVVLLLGPGAFLHDHHLVTTTAERIVLAWSGLRGALTITLVLALPARLRIVTSCSRCASPWSCLHSSSRL